MGVVRTGESAYDKEMDKWDTPQRQGGMRPDTFQAFPAMLYKAHQRDNGQWAVNDPFDENWSRRCHMIVRDERELRQQLDNGWRPTPQEALEYANRFQQAIADAAAERHFADQRLSEKARREAAAADAETNDHVPEIAAPKKRGRPAKVTE
jgi:hypothetical protein